MFKKMNKNFGLKKTIKKRMKRVAFVYLFDKL